MPNYIVPKLIGEWAFTLKGYGPDQGAWPASAPVGSVALTLDADDVSIDPGDNFADFASSQTGVARNRVIKANWEVTVSMKMEVQSRLLGLYNTNGPLVEFVGTAQNLIDSPSNDLVITGKGIMSGPRMKPGDPSMIEFTVKSYGQPLVVTPSQPLPA